MRAARAIWIGFFMGLFNLWMLSEVGSSVVDMVETQTPAAIRASVGPEGMYAGVADPLGEDFSVDIVRMQAKGNMGRTLDVALRLSGRTHGALPTPPSRWNPIQPNHSLCS